MLKCTFLNISIRSLRFNAMKQIFLLILVFGLMGENGILAQNPKGNYSAKTNTSTKLNSLPRPERNLKPKPKEVSIDLEKFDRLNLNPKDRILILAPHPDDEVLGTGGIIQKAVAMELPIKIVFLTYGDNNQWSFLLYRKYPVLLPKSVQKMGLVRHDEAIAADKLLGLKQKDLVFLGYPDFRTLEIWYAHWGKAPPAKSMLTEVRAIPYKNAFRPGSPHKGEEILKDLEAIISEFKPTKIFVSHPADHNRDHQAFYLFLRVALLDLGKKINPTVHPYLVHYKHWPKPKGYHPKLQIIPPSNFVNDISWQIFPLSEKVVNYKRKAIKKHWTQYEASPAYLLSFIRTNELFGDFPTMTLRPDNSSNRFTLYERNNDSLQMLEELNEEERTSYVGIKERVVKVKDNSVVISVELSRLLGKKTIFTLYLFGYRKDMDFSLMPKLCIKVSSVGYTVFDQNRKITTELIGLQRKDKQIIVNVPLLLLKNPRYIFTCAKTHLRTTPLDWDSWRILEIKP